VGALITFAGVVSLGRWLTPFPQPLPKSQLRTGGAYALVRHPLYSGILFMAFGWSLYSSSVGGTGVRRNVISVLRPQGGGARKSGWPRNSPAMPPIGTRVKKLIPWIY